ncbi:MAG: hypothetical protein ABEJ36_05775 [Candidatus Nanosalina sp.]
MGDWRQYGIGLIGIMLAFGFGGSMLANNYAGSSTTSPNSQEKRNFTLPSQNFVVGGFDRSLTEQVVVAARNDVVFVNAYYDTKEQREDLRQLKEIRNNFGDRAYIQVVNSSTTSEILSRNGIVNFPKVVVVSGTTTSRGLVPRQKVLSNTSQKKVERAICSVMTDLGENAAYCRRIGGF